MDGTGPKPRLHVFGFMDETGLLSTPHTDRFFALGLVVSQNPRELHRAIVRLKNKRRYHSEFKSTSISSRNLPVYKDLVDVFLSCTNNRFHCLILDKQGYKPPKKSHIAYNRLAASLIANAIDYKKTKNSEYLTLLADDISTSKDDQFERVIRDTVRQQQRRNALFGICRLESHAVSEIQLADVLLGLVAYAYKIKHEVVRGTGAKLDLLKYLQRKLNTDELSKEQALKMPRGEVFVITEHKK